MISRLCLFSGFLCFAVSPSVSPRGFLRFAAIASPPILYAGRLSLCAYDYGSFTPLAERGSALRGGLATRLIGAGDEQRFSNHRSARLTGTSSKCQWGGWQSGTRGNPTSLSHFNSGVFDDILNSMRAYSKGMRFLS